MLEFFTILALLIALMFQGGWWLGFVLLFLLWLRKLLIKKGVKKVTVKLAFDQWPGGPLPVDLVDALSSLAGRRCYVGAMIPEKKRAKVLATYPPPPGDGQILALLDTSLLRSGEFGIAVGRAGLSWMANSLRPPVQMSWLDLSESEIRWSFPFVIVDGLPIGVAGAGRSAVENFLRTMKIYAQAVALSDQDAGQDGKGEAFVSARTASGEQSLISINEANISDLLTLPGIGVAEAQKIIDRRGERAFTSIGELVIYLKLKPRYAEVLDGLIVFGPPLSAPLRPVETPDQTNVAETPKPVLAAAPAPDVFAGRMID